MICFRPEARGFLPRLGLTIGAMETPLRDGTDGTPTAVVDGANETIRDATTRQLEEAEEMDEAADATALFLQSPAWCDAGVGAGGE